MIKYINVYRMFNHSANITPAKIQREWLDELPNKHGYRCFPMAQANMIGWDISFNEDLSFVWDGITDTLPTHIEILEGEKYCHPNRGSATISFDTGLHLKTDNDVTIMCMPTPNYFRRGVQAYTTLLSTSFFEGPMPLAWRITEPNLKITVKAGEPIATIIPISMNGFKNFEVNLYDDTNNKTWFESLMNYGKTVARMNKEGNFSDFYRNATNHIGQKLGKHEVQALKQIVNDYRKNENE